MPGQENQLLSGGLLALARAEEYQALARKPSTLAIYQQSWDRWETWAVYRGVAPRPADPAHVAEWLAELADGGLAVATLRRMASGIAWGHRERSLKSPVDSPVVRDTLRGIRRALGVAQKHAAPLLLEQLLAVLAKIPGGPLGVSVDIRDRALLLLGWAGGFRRSELVGLRVSDLEYASGGPEGLQGMLVYLRVSKADQEGAGVRVPIPLGREGQCPVRAVQAWLWSSARRGDARVFGFNGATVTNIVKRRCAAAGLDPSRYSAHSLRAGLVTSALQAGRQAPRVQLYTRHASATAFQRYVRDGTDPWQHHPTAGLL